MFIKLYNVFGEESSKYHLTVDELYLYSLLRRLLNYKSETLITVDVLDQYTRKYSKIQFHSRQREGRQIIRRLLSSLLEKEVIKVDETITNTSNQLLKVTLVEDLTDGNIKGHEQIGYDYFDNVTDMTYFYIYFVVARFSSINDKVFNCSYERWADILGLSRNTAINYVDGAIENEVIYVNVGDYTDEMCRDSQKRRTSNQYSIVPFTEEEKSSMQRKEEKKEDLDLEVEVNEWGQDKKSNWFDWGARLTAEDFVELMKTDDEDVKLQAKRRIAALSKSEKGKYVVKALSNDAKRIMENKLESQARVLVDNDNKVVFAINGELVTYENWNHKTKPDFAYYEEVKKMYPADIMVDADEDDLDEEGKISVANFAVKKKPSLSFIRNVIST